MTQLFLLTEDNILIGKDFDHSHLPDLLPLGNCSVSGEDSLINQLRIAKAYAVRAGICDETVHSPENSSALPQVIPEHNITEDDNKRSPHDPSPNPDLDARL